MAIIGNHGILLVDAILTHTPSPGQATLARLQNTDTYYYYNGSAWITVQPSLLTPTEISGTSHVLPDSGGSFAYTNAADVVLSAPTTPVPGTIWYIYQDNTGRVGSDFLMGPTNVQDHYRTIGEGTLMTIYYWGGTFSSYRVIAGETYVYPPVNPELLLNGDFSNGGSSWTVVGTDANNTVTFSGGQCTIVSDGSGFPAIRQPGILTSAGPSYVMEVDIASVSGANGLDAFHFNPNWNVPHAVGLQTNTDVADDTQFNIGANGAGTTVINSVSIRLA